MQFRNKYLFKNKFQKDH